jgi:hypothetical protein
MKVQRTNSLESVVLPERQKLTCSQTVIALHTAIKELEDEIENPDSILNRTGASKKSELGLLVKNCVSVLQQLNQLLIKYKSLGTRSKRTWDRVRFGTENLQEIRDKLMVHTSSLTLFLTTLGTGSLGRIEKKLDELIADVRAGRRADTVLSMADNEEDEAEEQWNLWKGELIEEGLSKTELEEHKHWILAKLLERMENDGLEEPPVDGETVSTSAKGKAPEQSASPPPASLNVNKHSEKNVDSSPLLHLEPSKQVSGFQATVEDADEDPEDFEEGNKDAFGNDEAEVPFGPAGQSNNPSGLSSKSSDPNERSHPKSDEESEWPPVIGPTDIEGDDMNHYSSDSDLSSSSLVTCLPADSISQVGQTPRTQETKREQRAPNSSTPRRAPPRPASWVIDDKGVCYPKKYLPTIDDEDNPHDRNVSPQERHRATPNGGTKDAGDILEPFSGRNRTKSSKTKTSIPVRGAQKSGDQTEDDEILGAAQHDRNESHPRTTKKPVGQNSTGQNRAHSRKPPWYHGEVPNPFMRPDQPLPDLRSMNGSDPDCAICSRPASAECECESRAFNLALKQSELRSCAQDFITRRSAEFS